jgi:HAD superfamily hydrolase (TIGR01549 family)
MAISTSNAPARVLAWDCDGTLIDTTALIIRSLDHIYTRFYGRSLPEPDLRALIGTPLKSQIRVFGEPSDFGVDEAEITEAFITYYESHRAEERILHAVTAILIEGKQRGYPTALVTSKNLEELANTLPRLGIEPYLDVTITADDIPRPKPAPDGLLQAMSLLDAGPEVAQNSFYIGDTVHDMEAATGAGLQGVGVIWGAAGADSLRAAGARYVCRTPDELRALLFGQGEV